MKTSNMQNGIQIELAQLIANARDAECSRDIDVLESLLKEVWEDFDQEPDFSGIEPEVKAELLRICGYFLCVYGFSKQISGYQERGKDFLSKAVELFHELGKFKEVGRAKALLGSAYFQLGQMEETEIVLDEASLSYEDDHLNPVNLLICVTKLAAVLWRKDYQQALEILRDVQIPMELCEDPFLLVRYHTQAGMLFSQIGKFEEANAHYEKAIGYGNKLGNLRYVASTLNNLASSQQRLGNLELARRHSAKAIRIFEDIDEIGWLSMALDTRANIYLNEGELDSALSTIERSIKLFQQGEFYSGLTDALWVKVHILLVMNEKEKAFMTFAELTEIASKHIGRYAVRKYAKEFSKIVYVRKNQDFTEEVRSFKREMITESMLEANANTDQAAKLLKISRKKLTTTINKQFPEIYLELGITPTLMAA